MMTVELITVGTEILLGNIVNTNAAYLSGQLARIGMSVYNQQVVGDNRERLEAALRLALGRADVVILTGGLGPTEDDLTRDVVSGVMECPLAEDAAVRGRIEKMLNNSIYKDNIPDSNYRQAMVPQGAVVIDNDNGTAPGLIIEKGDNTVIMLPGPPDELVPMFSDKIAPYLSARNPQVIYSRMVRLCGQGESQVEEAIRDLVDSQGNLTIATYARPGLVDVRITAGAQDEQAAKDLVKPLVKELKNRFKEDVYSTDEDERMEDVVVKLLRKRGLKLMTAESCTGGLIAGRIVNVSGASEIFGQGLVTYSNKAKRKLLGVDKALIKKCGVVSKEVAKEMAKGGIMSSDADICVSVTGVAGPGESDGKPAGLVYIGCYYKDKVTVREYQFKGNRQKVREQAVVMALDLVRRSIQSEE
jgi:nicotinamide-nucleotide amidase